MYNAEQSAFRFWGRADTHGASRIWGINGLSASYEVYRNGNHALRRISMEVRQTFTPTGPRCIIRAVPDPWC